jgi:hypothetical protein
MGCDRHPDQLVVASAAEIAPVNRRIALTQHFHPDFGTFIPVHGFA